MRDGNHMASAIFPVIYDRAIVGPRITRKFTLISFMLVDVNAGDIKIKTLLGKCAGLTRRRFSTSFLFTSSVFTFARYSFIHATLRISWYSYEFSEETHEILFTNLLIIGFHGNSIHTADVKIKYIRGFLIREPMRRKRFVNYISDKSCSIKNHRRSNRTTKRVKQKR